eukprot:gene17597-23928_t
MANILVLLVALLATLLPSSLACSGNEEFVVVITTQHTRLMYALSSRVWRQGICAVLLTGDDPKTLPARLLRQASHFGEHDLYYRTFKQPNQA